MDFLRSLGGLATSLVLLACGADPAATLESDATEVFPAASDEALSIVAMVNDPATTAEVLRAGGVTARAAKNLLAHRDGPDATPRTTDDDPFDALAEVDAVPQVGSATIRKLAELADARGYLEAQRRREVSVIFSPQPIATSHNARVADLIYGAERSIDVAMYSYSDPGIHAALADATARGVKVRFLFETASKDRKLTGAQLQSSRSGRLESIGVDVRWVNKIMHHKFMIVDGPRDSLDAAKTAHVVSGSGNWSNGAATKYDENTLFLSAMPEVALRMQREFDTLWEGSRDLVANPELVFEASTVDVTDADLPVAPGFDALFTSANFTANGDTFSLTGADTVADGLVAAIEAAEDRIHVASGHLRSRPVSEALMRKRAEDPDVEIRVYLDGQEYISASTHTQQETNLEACLSLANTEAKQRSCRDKGFLFGYAIGRAGIDVRYKYYAYRWDVTYAAQMHNKFLIVDDALYTGSYNLSDNAEHNTFENMLVFRGPEFRELVGAYEDEFEAMWSTGEGKLDGLMETIRTETTIPIVFDAMSLSWQRSAISSRSSPRSARP
jgi:phosphatidylserine/phosphatidylglycerophosphate/cardiolipin synthase-like enzyme